MGLRSKRVGWAIPIGRSAEFGCPNEFGIPMGLRPKRAGWAIPIGRSAKLVSPFGSEVGFLVKEGENWTS